MQTFIYRMSRTYKKKTYTEIRHKIYKALMIEKCHDNYPKLAEEEKIYVWIKCMWFAGLAVLFIILFDF